MKKKKHTLYSGVSAKRLVKISVWFLQGNITKKNFDRAMKVVTSPNISEKTKSELMLTLLASVDIPKNFKF